MKKIIAMLLCVAMVAAFAVTAFAAGPFQVAFSASTIEEYYKKDIADAKADAANKSPLEQYAANLKAAEKALKDAKKELETQQKAAVDAIKAAQNYLVATAYEVAIAELQVDIQKAIAQAYFDYTEDFIGGDWTINWTGDGTWKVNLFVD